MVLRLVKRYKYILILIAILLLSFILRTYQFTERFNYDHDNDLASWVIKDVLVNNHFRLIGQLTSAPGIFIGPLFYYLLIPFYLLFNMDPLGGVWLITILGVLTTLSFYLVFSKLFTKEVGLIGAFLQAASLYLIFFDRRVVPSTPTNLWAVWFFYVVIMISRGNYKVLPLLGILLGLIWNIHIALLPALVALPAAFLIARKIPSLRQVFLTAGAFILTSTPLIIFEGKHNFMQTVSLINNLTTSHGGSTGLDKLNLVSLKMMGNILNLIFSPIILPHIDHRTLILIVVLAITLALRKKIMDLKDFLPLGVWILGVVLFFTFSSSPVSEYYFSSVEVIYLSILSLALAKMLHISKTGRIIALSLLALFLIKIIFFYATTPVYQKGYIAKKAVAQYLLEDSKEKQFPCLAISYITAPGENAGFRYFFWLNKLHVAPISNESPVYTIVVPDELAADDVKIKFGHIGIIPPQKIPSQEAMKKACSGENTNLTDSMFGYTE